MAGGKSKCEKKVPCCRTRHSASPLQTHLGVIDIQTNSLLPAASHLDFLSQLRFLWPLHYDTCEVWHCVTSSVSLLSCVLFLWPVFAAWNILSGCGYCKGVSSDLFEAGGCPHLRGFQLYQIVFGSCSFTQVRKSIFGGSNPYCATLQSLLSRHDGFCGQHRGHRWSCPSKPTKPYRTFEQWHRQTTSAIKQ